MKIVTRVTFRVRKPLTALQMATFERFADVAIVPTKDYPTSGTDRDGYGFEYFYKHTTAACDTVFDAVGNAEYLTADSLGFDKESDEFAVVEISAGVV